MFAHSLTSHGLRRGFTLLELIVSVSITVVLAGIMISVTVNVLTIWQRTQNAQTQTTAAMLVLDAVERDLHGALRMRDNFTTFAATIVDSADGLRNHGWSFSGATYKPPAGGSLRPLPALNGEGARDIADARFGLSGVWLRFVATNLESGESLPCVISYKISRRPLSGNPDNVNNPAPIRYSLYRSAVSASETFARGYDVTNAAYESSNNNVSSVFTITHRNPSNVMNPSHANLIASNVVDFGCWLYARQSNGALMRVFPESENDLAHLARGDSAVNSTRFPHVADLFVRILSEEGATALELIESGRQSRPGRFATDAEWWWAVVEEHSRVFIRRIELKGAQT